MNYALRFPAKSLTDRVVLKAEEFTETLRAYLAEVDGPRCSTCGEPIKPDLCWCGEAFDGHTGEHGFVPLGCTCGFVEPVYRSRQVSNLLIMLHIAMKHLENAETHIAALEKILFHRDASHDLAVLQAQNAEWAGRNFPDSLPHQPLLGALEELGALAHLHLKSEQGIRGAARRAKDNLTPLDLAKTADEVGDIVIFLAHYCTLAGIDLSQAVADAWGEVRLRDWIAYPETGRPAKEV